MALMIARTPGPSACREIYGQSAAGTCGRCDVKPCACANRVQATRLYPYHRCERHVELVREFLVAISDEKPQRCRPLGGPVPRPHRMDRAAVRDWWKVT